MAPTKFRLTPNELKVPITFLFEPFGYLDFIALVSTGQTATEALVADPTLEMDSWVYDQAHIDDFGSNLRFAKELALFWWIRKNDRVASNQPPPQPRFDDYVAALDGFSSSIDQALFSVPIHIQEDSGNPVSLFDENKALIGTTRSGTWLLLQRGVYTKVLDFLDE